MKKTDMLRIVADYLYNFVSNVENEEEVEKVIRAMKYVDRKYFVDDEKYAYDDSALSIGENQTISQPSTVGRMIMLAKIKEGNAILELGAGSGWNAALMSYLAYPGEVLSLDIIDNLIKKAESNIEELKQNVDKDKVKFNVDFEKRNILKDYKKIKDKYDRIVITAGISKDQEKIIDDIAGRLLKDQGILVCPYGSGPMMILTRKEGKIEKDFTTEYYGFVPLLE